jgi:hypothetical protein
LSPSNHFDTLVPLESNPTLSSSFLNTGRWKLLSGKWSNPMNVLKESAELQELLEAMDAVIGATPVSPQSPEQAPTVEVEDEDIQPILDRIERREKQRAYAARSGA